MIAGQMWETAAKALRLAPLIPVRTPAEQAASMIVGHTRLYSPWMTRDHRPAQISGKIAAGAPQVLHSGSG
ncbi:MAG: hypothetical protein ACRDNW_12200 [Trebonia sp.]